MTVQNYDEKNFQEEVKGETPTVVDFWAPWCGPCRTMAPVLDELEKEFGGKVKFAKVNVDENQELAGKFGIRGIPCLVVMKNGEELDRIIGLLPKAALKAKIEAIVG